MRLTTLRGGLVVSPFEIENIVADRRRRFVAEAVSARLAAVVTCCRPSMVARFAVEARSRLERVRRSGSACCTSA